MKKSLKFKSAIALAIVAVFSCREVAYGRRHMWEENLTEAVLYKYDYVRTHTYDGPISWFADNMPAGYLRLGLRNMKHPESKNRRKYPARQQAAQEMDEVGELLEIWQWSLERALSSSW